MSAPDQAPVVPALVAADDLQVRFGGVTAVAGVSFTLDAGQCCGLIGANGSGKSTLLAALSRLCHGQEHGDIRLAGTSAMGWTPARVARWGVARTFQTVRLVADLDVAENVLVGATPASLASSADEPDSSAPASRAGTAPSRAGAGAGGGPGGFWPRRRRRAAEAAARVEEALDIVGVGEHRRRRPDELPYGLQRRVEIARAIVARPRVLLLDEPTAGMTGAERAELGELFRRLAEGGMAVLVVEHDVRFVTTTCDVAFALDAGAVIARGTPEQVIASPEVRQAYLGTAAAGPAAPGPAATGGSAP